MTYLASEGYSLRDMLDYEDGLTLEQIGDLVIEHARHAVTRQKTQALTTAAGVASVFNAEVLTKFSDSLDQELENRGIPVESGEGNGSGKIEREQETKERRRSRNMRKTMRELAKLQKVMGVRKAGKG